MSLKSIALMAAMFSASLPNEHGFMSENRPTLNTDKISISGKPNRKRGKYKPNQFKKRKGK